MINAMSVIIQAVNNRIINSKNSNNNNNNSIYDFDNEQQAL